MANTYTQIHIHVVFAVKYRAALIDPTWEHELYKYLTGIIQNHGHKMIQINGMPDHIHLLIGLRPIQSLSALMRSVKSRSTEWINKTKFKKRRFLWQAGYGAFSLSREHVPVVINYIAKQKEHHRSKSFNNEFIDLLEEEDIEFDRRFLFKTVN